MEAAPASSNDTLSRERAARSAVTTVTMEQIALVVIVPSVNEEDIGATNVAPEPLHAKDVLHAGHQGTAAMVVPKPGAANVEDHIIVGCALSHARRRQHLV